MRTLETKKRCVVPGPRILTKRVFLGRVLTLAVMMVAGFWSPVQAQTVSPRQLLEVADFGAPVVSPDGSRVAFRIERASVERNTYDTTWYVQELADGAEPRRVADGGVPLRDAAGISSPAVPVWSPDGRWIHYIALMDGRIDVWRAAADGSGAEPLALDAADVREFSVNDDGRELFYRVGATREEVAAAEQAEYDNGIRIDKQVPIGQGLFRSVNIEGRWATQRYVGMWFGRAALLADAPQRWKAIDLASLQRRDLPASYQPSRPPVASDLSAGLPRPWKLASDPGTGRIAMLTRVGNSQGLRDAPGVQLSMLPDKSSSRPVVCMSEMCAARAITGIQWRPRSDEVLFTVTEPDAGYAQSIFRWNVGSGVVLPVTQAAGLVNGGRDRFSGCGVSAATLVCITADANQPPQLERIDLDSGRRQLLFAPNSALAGHMQAIPAQPLRWTDADGQVFTGQLFQARPAGGAPSPLFVTYYHCSGFLRGGVGDEWPLASLAEHGISALCINDPPGYLVDAVERFGRGLSGVRSAVELLAADGRIDPKKVGMGGLSFGSEVTLWTASHSDLLAAASITSPEIEPNYFLFNALRDDAFFAELRKSWGLGSPEETPDRWRVISPTYHLEQIRAPFLFQIPEQEYLYSLGFSLPLVREQRADLYVFPNEPHQKFQPRHKLAAYERNVDWFRFWLQGHEDGHPAKTGQYAYWRQMRTVMKQRDEAP